jgi:hypothetical protein
MPVSRRVTGSRRIALADGDNLIGRDPLATFFSTSRSRLTPGLGS